MDQRYCARDPGNPASVRVGDVVPSDDQGEGEAVVFVRVVVDDSSHCGQTGQESAHGR